MRRIFNFLPLSLVFTFSYIPQATAQLPENYEAQSAVQKQHDLWNEVCAEQYSSEQLPGLNFQASWSGLTSALSFLSLGRSFSHAGDELPAGRGKVIHALGTVAPITFKSTESHPFTGLLAEKEAVGLARLSLAAPPALAGFTPGMALKLFVDQVPSMNLQVMTSLEGQGGDYNFFSNSFSNSLPPITSPLNARSVWEFAKLTNLKIVEQIFATVKANPRELSVAHLASVQQDGTPVENPIYPEVLTFVPNQNNRDRADEFLKDNAKYDFRIYLNQLNPDSILYYVFGDYQGLRYTVGVIVMEQRFCASAYGDKKLFFRHHM